jgi:hypothetical protein
MRVFLDQPRYRILIGFSYFMVLILSTSLDSEHLLVAICISKCLSETRNFLLFVFLVSPSSMSCIYFITHDIESALRKYEKSVLCASRLGEPMPTRCEERADLATWVWLYIRSIRSSDLGCCREKTSLVQGHCSTKLATTSRIEN